MSLFIIIFLKSLLNLLRYCFYFLFLGFGHGSLAPWLGIEIEPAPPALEGEILTAGPPGRSLKCPSLNFKCIISCTIEKKTNRDPLDLHELDILPWT